MKKVLSLILAIVMILSCVPMTIAADADFEKLVDAATTYNYYCQSIFNPIEEVLEGTTLTNVSDWLKGKLEIALVDYPDIYFSEDYFEKNPDQLEPITAILNDIIKETEEKIASGDFVVVANMVTIIGQFNEIMGRIGLTLEDYNSLIKTLPENTAALVEEKYGVLNSILDEVSTDYTTHSAEEIDAAAKEFFDFLSVVVDCKLGNHKTLSVIDNGNGTHSRYCLFCGYTGEVSAHSFAEYTSTDFGLTIERCISCTALNVTVDEALLSNVSVDTYIQQLAKYQSSSINLYSSEEDLSKVNTFFQEAFVKFDKEISETFGQEGFSFDISRAWIEANADKLPVITAVFGYTNAMIDKSRADGDIIVVVDTIELINSLCALNASHKDAEINAFSEKLDPETLISFNECSDKVGNILASSGVYPLQVTQEEFDEAAAPVINIYNQVKNCLDGNHTGEYVDLGGGTHELDCTFCKNIGTPEEHSWGEYISNGDATTESDGTKTAKCESCSATNTITDEGSKLPQEQEKVDNIIDLITDFIDTIKNLFALIADLFKNLFV